jgi:hypothetical protein
MTQLLSDAALALAKGGWKVFPVDAVSKRPRSMHGHLDATTDPKKIQVWKRQFNYGGAIATPTGDGLLVIDVDPRNGGRVPAWAPATRLVRTQSGGLHLHYKVDEDIKSRASLFGRGVDSKSAGGYVLLPPSPGYEWLDLRDRTALSKSFLEGHFAAETTSTGGAVRLAPDKWYRGIIHDQVVAWAAYFAGELDTDDEVVAATWSMVEQAKAAGLTVDNARGHIDGAIRWVLLREGAKDAPPLD